MQNLYACKPMDIYANRNCKVSNILIDYYLNLHTF